MLSQKNVKRFIYLLGIVAVVLGIYGFYSRLFFGERDVNYGSYVNWGLWVAMYLFFAGMAAGSYMVATLDYVFNLSAFKGTGKYGLWAAMVTLPGALIFIGFDLGHMERVWKVYLQPNFSSLLAQLVWSYTLFLIVTVTSLYFAMRNNLALLKPIMVVGLVLAIFVSGGVGALLGVNASRATLHTAMLPAQFPILNLTSGVALMLLIVNLFNVISDEEQRNRLTRILRYILVVLIIVKAYFLWVDYSQALYSGVPDAVDAVNLVLFGTYGWAFWILQVGLGMVLPVIVLLQPNLSNKKMLVGLMGLLVLLGLAVARTAIIFPAMAIPELEGLAEAFTGPHLGYDYVPSLMEWSVTLGIVGLSTLAFLIGTDFIGFFKDSSEVAK
ncbi:MAG: polysulfide reductase [Phototrophicales bacterium]|nr:MAG: polysulfide reductase [Phototrophicales bacterium]RMG69996.1 MAG: polysulfide reductase [Chloroflexota bacterium]